MKKIEEIQFDKIRSLKEFGFDGFCSIASLMADEVKVPCQRGNYIIYTPRNFVVDFVRNGPGGFFKNKNPNVAVDILEKKWINNSRVIYIGQAGGITKGKWSCSTLNERLCAYMRFGQGWPIGHWGGRYIWQIKDFNDLKVCWISWREQIQDPREFEKHLLVQFKEQFGRFPFANLKG